MQEELDFSRPKRPIFNAVLIRKGKRFALVPFDATPERRQELLTALEK